MTDFRPNPATFVAQIKKEIRSFIENSQVIDESLKQKFINEIGRKLNDDRFDGTKFIEDAIGYSVFEWRAQNFKLAEFWKELALNNAKVNNKPHQVADETIDRFKEKFNCV